MADIIVDRQRDYLVDVQTLAIIPWHLFSPSNREGTNYFFSRSFSVLLNFPPP